jgi:TPR repeat protein
MSRRALPLALVLALGLAAAAAAPAAAQPPAEAARALIAQGDRVYARRGTPKDFWEAIYYYDQAFKADPQSYEAAWKLSRCYTGLGGGTEKSQRRDYGAKSMVYAAAALKLNPDRVEGWYFSATSIGLYASGLGVLRAVREGIQKRFLRYIRGAIARDPSYDYAAPLMVYGRYFYELPWPLRDLDDSVRYLGDARRRAPTKIRTALYLAESLLAKGDRAAALRELVTCARMDPAREDAYDGRTTVRDCQARLARELRR